MGPGHGGGTLKSAAQNRRGSTGLLSLILLLTLGLSASETGAQETVDDETCLACHEDYDRGLSSTPHRLSSSLTDSKRVDVSCSGCHPGGDIHVDDPSIDNITNPGREHQETVRICLTCHDPHLELDNVGFDPHLQQGLSCASCHSVHGGNDRLLLDESSEFCGACHVGLAAQWSRTSSHPLREDQVQCLSCHDFTGGKEPSFGHGLSENCTACHAEVSGPFLFEHNATSSFYPDGGGCVECHSPHGSPNERLLTQPGDLLCTQCHGVPPLHRSFHDGIGTQFQCIECHADIHGSDDNRGLLDADLGAKIEGTPTGCSCHGTDD